MTLIKHFTTAQPEPRFTWFLRKVGYCYRDGMQYMHLEFLNNALKWE